MERGGGVGKSVQILDAADDLRPYRRRQISRSRGQQPRIARMASSSRTAHLFDDTGNAVRLGATVGRGGQGIVYEIVQRPESLAKLFDPPLDARRATKIRAMASLY